MAGILIAVEILIICDDGTDDGTVGIGIHVQSQERRTPVGMRTFGSKHARQDRLTPTKKTACADADYYFLDCFIHHILLFPSLSSLQWM